MTILTPNTSTTSSTENPQQPAPASSKSYSYSDTFYRYIQAGSVRSASHVVPLVLRELSPESVLDVGCGAGAWLSVYGNLGVADYLGVDGAYVASQARWLITSSGMATGLCFPQPLQGRVEKTTSMSKPTSFGANSLPAMAISPSIYSAQ